MELGLLTLRVVVGALFAGHGAQKLFGWFGGHGLDGTGSFFESLGLTPGRRLAIMAGTAELIGGLLLALGFLLPAAAALLIAVMTAAVWAVHGRKGLWNANGGFEYNLVLAAVAFALVATGAGSWSLDAAFGLDAAGAQLALLSLVAGVIGGASTVWLARHAPRRTRWRRPATASGL